MEGKTSQLISAIHNVNRCQKHSLDGSKCQFPLKNLWSLKKNVAHTGRTGRPVLDIVARSSQLNTTIPVHRPASSALLQCACHRPKLWPSQLYYRVVAPNCSPIPSRFDVSNYFCFRPWFHKLPTMIYEEAYDLLEPVGRVKWRLEG